ncbi:hypothetical protein GCM10007385_11250 [Tateyamaria omphalii]|uniref:DUF898 family protein n=1 Tax=Tateyamaria omphalii TaxID=299262 RepID=UPI001677F4CB|nr:DUF898 family protein [Tateyamaria omphalii]GGX45033.1 hypothetical protein GCM10007385_11250 [Tateyamaria omphalii]
MNTQIDGRYFGKGGPLFKLYLVTAVLTVLTLGVYRFWAKTRIRKYIWSSVSGDDDSFEYTGTGLEKFLGFLVAIVILAIYLGIVQMALFFFGLNLFVLPDTPGQEIAQFFAIYVTLLAVVPLMLFARYRARRYRMARTRWRGIRFGMENGAWGYAFRAIGYYLLVLLSLGLLNPLATFKLEKYMADRTWYGDGRFVQTGKWTDLYGGMKHLLIAFAILAAGIIAVAMAGTRNEVGTGVFGGVLLFVGYVWALIGLIYYRVYAFNYLTARKRLDDHVTFLARLETSAIIGKIVVGSIVVGVVVTVVFGVIGSIGAGIFMSMSSGTDFDPNAGTFLGLALIGVLYAGAILATGGLSLVLITQPVIAHAVEHVTVLQAEHLDSIRQRSADKGADAEGFADALDVGGAI